jgi:ligand-binding SRPBCC domain-containing protein
MYTLQREITVPLSRDQVFDFFKRPENLSALTPPSMQFKILTPGPIEMSAGALIDYTVKIMGFENHWRTLIADYNPPERFVDVQLEGPYRLWHHTHRFVDHGHSTTIIDEVRYIVPFGFLGRIINHFVIRYQLGAIFDYRQKVISNIFGIVKDNLSGMI